jgi:hypothetical protein
MTATVCFWKNFVMVFNEMGHAKTTQIDTV